MSRRRERRPGTVSYTHLLAERYREEIQKEIPEVDATVGIGCNGDIAGLVGRVCLLYTSRCV